MGIQLRIVITKVAGQGDPEGKSLMSWSMATETSSAKSFWMRKNPNMQATSFQKNQRICQRIYVKKPALQLEEQGVLRLAVNSIQVRLSAQPQYKMWLGM